MNADEQFALAEARQFAEGAKFHARRGDVEAAERYQRLAEESYQEVGLDPAWSDPEALTVGETAARSSLNVHAAPTGVELTETVTGEEDGIWIDSDDVLDVLVRLPR